MPQNQDRSPLSPKALTLQELQALPVGTKLVFFHGFDAFQQEAIFGGFRESWQGLWVNLWYDVGGDCTHVEDLGLRPYSKGGWNPLQVLVLPGDAHTLPTKPIVNPDWSRCF